VTLLEDADARRIIEDALDESLLVEAAAGTGKTTELVRRIARVIARGTTTIDKVVAVTFTRKAAGELKIRLRHELDRQSKSAGPEERVRLEEATARLEEARIGTIHSFCAEILRERPVEARVDPMFEELGEDEAPRLFRRAFGRWMQEKLTDPPPGVARAMSRKLRWDRRTPAEKLLEAGQRLVEWRDSPARWTKKRFDRTTEIEQLLDRVRALAIDSSRCDDPRDRLHQNLACTRELTLELDRREQDAPRDYDFVEGRLIELLSDLRRSQAKGTGPFGPGITRESVLRAKDSLEAELERFQRRADADLAAALQGELQEVIDRYEDEKNRTGKLDFGDLLLRVRDLVRDDAGVRAFLQARHSHLFIDEFQDTDPLQTEILLLLSADDPSHTDWRTIRPAPGKLFLVGDPKQSIYRFRRADVVLYQQVRRTLSQAGVRVVHLSRSFRAPEPIQRAVNFAFEPEMIEDPASGQPGYVPLEGGPALENASQPAIVALPVPEPHGRYGTVYKSAVEASLPGAVGAFVEWLLTQSGWTVRDPKQPDQRVPIQPRHVCILFKRYLSFGFDVTAPYVRSLEGRNVPHVLVGSRSFFEREEVEALRAALASIEWPEDELSAYATLHGPLFGIPDDILLRWKRARGSFAPLDTDEHAEIEPEIAAVQSALTFLMRLSRERNDRPIVDTLNTLLDATRAHAGFALRPAGNQVLANVQRICDLARSFELSGGLSFRGFVERVDEEAGKERSSEAPIFEEGTEGVRIMTVHAAKGLEFPAVILADLTNALSFKSPDRYLDQARGLSATRLMGCAPWELTEHLEEEKLRDEAEGVRVAYVAATRARDLLVVPAIDEGPSEKELGRTWVAPLNRIIYPPRKNLIPTGPHRATPDAPEVHWFDLRALDLGFRGVYGLRQEQFLAKDDAGEALAGIERYERWQKEIETAIEAGSIASMFPMRASDAAIPPENYRALIDEMKLPRASERPSGRRFGTLVHAILRDVPLDADRATIDELSEVHGRVLGADLSEIHAAVLPVVELLSHDLIARARSAERTMREHPIVFEADDGTLLDGTIDLLFFAQGRWTVVDFKTDADVRARRDQYLIQMKWYCCALENITRQPVSGILLSI
jgi:ATP-dependent helicase/nuclease subunit A